jgi:predicted CoA-binding protein
MDDKALKKYLEDMKMVAIVGASNKIERASNGIMKYLMKNGYECYPVNPMEDEVLGVKCYKTLYDIPVKLDLVDIFRKSETTPPIVKAAVEKKAGFIWMQEGVENEESRKIAEEAGIPYIENKCLFKEMLRLRVKL